MSNKIILTIGLFIGIAFGNFKYSSIGPTDLKLSTSVAFNDHYECLMDMIKLNFKRNATVTIFSDNDLDYTQMESNLIKDIFNSLSCSVYLYTQMTPRKMTPLGVRRNFIIILGKKSLKVVLGFLHSFYIWDSKAVFLIVVENLQNQKNIVIENIENRTGLNELNFRIMVEHIFLGSNLAPITEHYLSNPSKVFRSTKVYEKLSKIGCCTYGNASTASVKVHSKSTMRELRIGVIHAPPFLFIQPEKGLIGSESKLVETVAEKMNMSISYRNYSNIDNLGDLYVSDENSIYGSGMLNDLVLNNIDIAVGNIVISEKVHRVLEMSMTYAVDRIIWILPEPRLVFQSPFFPFTYGFKITFFLISMYLVFPYLAFMATNHFHTSSNDECSRYRTFRGTCITYFAMSTGSIIDVQPRTLRMKFFLFIWLFYTYHLNMYFSSTLVWFFAVEHYGPALKTVDELLASGINLGLDNRTYNYFKDHLFQPENQDDERMFHKNLIICNSTTYCLSRIVRDRNFSMTLSYNYFKFVKHMYKGKNGKSLLTYLPETIVSAPIGIIFKKGCHFEQTINDIVLRINEAGLFNYWTYHTKHDRKIRHKVKTEFESRKIDANYSLKFYDLKMAFVSMIIELFVCCLIFIGELISYGWNRRRHISKTSNSNEEALFHYVN